VSSNWSRDPRLGGLSGETVVSVGLGYKQHQGVLFIPLFPLALIILPLSSLCFFFFHSLSCTHPDKGTPLLNEAVVVQLHIIVVLCVCVLYHRFWLWNSDVGTSLFRSSAHS